jgi:hypothetical protein
MIRALPSRLPAGPRNVLVVVCVAGVASFAYGLATEPVRAWSGFLVAAFYFLTIALGAAVFLAAMSVSNAAWSSVLKRVPEALTAYLPYGAAAMLAVLAGAHDLYHWSHADAVAKDAVLQAKASYLNLPFFAARMGVFLGVWILFAYLLRRRSRRQDQDGDMGHTRGHKKLSAGFLVVFAYTFTFASFDWLMSLEPHWSSTLYAFYNMAGVLVAGVAGITVATIVLRRRGLLPGVTEHHLHDLGKLLFAFCTFWAYLWISQYLLIWYANLSEEIPHLVRRTEGGWSLLFWLNVALGFVLPFFALLARRAKRVETHLLWVCGALFLGRFLDLTLLVAPANLPEHPGIGVSEVGTFAGLAALFVWAVWRGLRAAPLVARRDPYLEEGLHLHQ